MSMWVISTPEYKSSLRQRFEDTAQKLGQLKYSNGIQNSDAQTYPVIKGRRFEWSGVCSMLNTALFALYTDLIELGEKSYADSVLSENGLSIAKS